MLAERTPLSGMAPDERLPDDTRLWAALQNASGGTWAGCVYDVERIIELLEAGERALSTNFGERIERTIERIRETTKPPPPSLSAVGGEAMTVSYSVSSDPCEQ